MKTCIDKLRREIPLMLSKALDTGLLHFGHSSLVQLPIFDRLKALLTAQVRDNPKSVGPHPKSLSQHWERDLENSSLSPTIGRRGWGMRASHSFLQTDKRHPIWRVNR